MEEEASLYVLGMLPADEARRFEAAMAADAELARLVGQLETGAAAMAAMAPAREPSPALRGRIMAQIQAESKEPVRKIVQFRTVTTWLPWAVAACLALSTALLAYERFHLRLLVDNFLLRDRLQQGELEHVQTRETMLQQRLDNALADRAATNSEKAELQAQLSSLNREVADLKSRDALSQIKIATLSSMIKDAPQAMAVIAWDGAAQQGILKTLNMPAARPDQNYQLWIIDPNNKQPVSAGVFNPAANSRFQPLHPISKAGKFAISLEKQGGSETPLGPIVLVGE